MTKSDFEFLVEILIDCKPASNDSLQFQYWIEVCKTTIGHLKDKYPRFDDTRFRMALAHRCWTNPDLFKLEQDDETPEKK